MAAATMVAAAPMMAMIIFWLKNGSDLGLSSMATTFFSRLILSNIGCPGQGL
jgi:hypothetical protein